MNDLPTDSTSLPPPFLRPLPTLPTLPPSISTSLTYPPSLFPFLFLFSSPFIPPSFLRQQPTNNKKPTNTIVPEPNRTKPNPSDARKLSTNRMEQNGERNSPKEKKEKKKEKGTLGRDKPARCQSKQKKWIKLPIYLIKQASERVNQASTRNVNSDQISIPSFLPFSLHTPHTQPPQIIKTHEKQPSSHAVSRFWTIHSS